MPTKSCDHALIDIRTPAVPASTLAEFSSGGFMTISRND
jgi:hypothetical protein